VCYDCIYDLEIDIKDKCNNNLEGFTKITKTLGKIKNPDMPFNTVCSDGQIVNFNTSDLNDNQPLLVQLEVGEYTITKTLKVNAEARTYYLNQYLQSNCTKTIDDFKNNIPIDTTGCVLSCDACVQALGTQDAYVTAGKGSTEDWIREYNVCREPCEYINSCETSYLAMLSDMAPSGQYGEWQDEENQINVSLHDLSIYNPNNKLTKRKLIVSGAPLPLLLPDVTASWKNPK